MDAAALGFRPDDRHDLVDRAAEVTGCSLRSSGRVNFRKPCTTSSSRRISSRDDVDVLQRLGRRTAGRRRVDAETATPPPHRERDAGADGANCCRSSSR